MAYKPIPVGVENFKRIIDDGHYYVDKTLMIKDIIDKKTAVNLFTRPRRFGKTLNMSMIQYFFEKTDEDNSYLFNGLKISKAGDKYKDYMGKYPVISLSLKSLKQPDFDYSFSEFKMLIKKEFWRHKKIFSSDKIDVETKKLFEQIVSATAEDKIYFTALKLLSDCLCKVHEKNVILLIDEYDVPLENAHMRGFYNEMTDLIRSAFEGVLKTNNSLEFGILTGCLRISKESIFTGLNNLNVYSIINTDFSEYFGFTKDEVKDMLDFYELSENFEEAKQWYDGYIFGKKEIYNPWSITKFVMSLNSKEEVSALPYWSNTSSNDIIRELVFEGNENVKSIIEELINGETITKPVYEDITYRNVNINTDYIWSFLLFTGYLKPIEKIIINDDLHMKMVIPNREVKSIYRNTIMQWFDEKLRTQSREDLFDAMIQGDVKCFNSILSDWFYSSVSYYDTKENYYHGFLTGVLSGFYGYKLKSNRESGNGRSDIMIYDNKNYERGIIIEIKSAKSPRELDDKCDEALKQIEDMNYSAELYDMGIDDITKYAVAFYEKTCRVKKAD